VPKKRRLLFKVCNHYALRQTFSDSGDLQKRKHKKHAPLTGCMQMKNLFPDYSGNSGKGKTDFFRLQNQVPLFPLCIANGL
jgi:hypothetical protein